MEALLCLWNYKWTQGEDSPFLIIDVLVGSPTCTVDMNGASVVMGWHGGQSELFFYCCDKIPRPGDSQRKLFNSESTTTVAGNAATGRQS